MKKKNLVKLLATAVMFNLLGGCSSGGETVKKTEISVITNERSIMEVMQGLVDNYNETNDKNIYINFECKDDSYGDYINTTYTSKNPPDIHIRTSNAELAREAGWLRPLPDDLAQKCKEEFIDSCIVEESDGKIYSVGLTAGGAQKLIYNKDLFEECGLDPNNPPTTFDEMREYAKIITEKGDGIKYGFAMPLKDDIFSRYYVMIPGAPSGLFNRDGFVPTENKFDFTIYERMINYLRDLISDGSVFPTPYTLDNDTARAQFSEGNVGMIYGAAWDVGVYNDQFPAKCDFGIVNFPVFDELVGGYPYGAATQSHWYMSSMSENPDAQLEVYKWLISEEVAVELLKENAITASTRKSLQDKIPEINKKGAAEFAERTYPLFKLDEPIEPAGLKISGDGRYSVIKNLVTDSSLDVNKTLKELTDKYNDAMKVLAEELKKKGESIDKYYKPDWNFIIEYKE